MDAGYAIFPDVIPGPECAVILDEVSGSRVRAGTRHMLAHPAVRRLTEDERLKSLAARFVGTRATPFSATLFAKTEQANWLIGWHQDTALPMQALFEAAGWGPWSKKAGIHFAHAPAWALSRVIALRVHLDDSTQKNGPLRVLPGLHLDGVLTDEQVLVAVGAGDTSECVIPAGGVIAMRPLLVHASSKSVSSEPRRVLHILYAEGLELAAGFGLR